MRHAPRRRYVSRETLAALLWLSAPSAGAQVPQLAAEERALATHDLARVMVGEAGWTREEEHAALAWTLSRRAAFLATARGWSWRRTARAYATSTLARPRSPQHVWVNALPALGAAQPRGWPRNVRWSVHTPLWVAARDRAARFFAGRLPDPCRGPSEHWAAPGYAFARAQLRAGSIARVDCGATRNHFYLVRRRLRLDAGRRTVGADATR